MRQLSKQDKEEIIQKYLQGESIEKLYKSYKVGDKRIRQILVDRNIPINNSHKKTISTDSYIEENEARYPFHEGYQYIAICKVDQKRFADYLNKNGCLISHIKNVLGIEIPSLYNRKKYFHEYHSQWYEQWFDIVEEKREIENAKVCPYCGWKTIDITNKSGMFETHLLKEHGITKQQYLLEYPEDKLYFIGSNPMTNLQLEEDENKFVVCPICGQKLKRITGRHLLKHGLTKKEFFRKYLDYEYISNDTKIRLRMNCINTNMNMQSLYSSRAEQEISDLIKGVGLCVIQNERKLLGGKELDIYVPDKRFAIEYNGNFWHQEGMNNKDKNSHVEKTELCKQRGIRLVQIFEDEYVNHKEIVNNKILHLLGQEQNLPKIMGRKCDIKEVDNKTAERFLNEYHIQGYARAMVYLGAYFNDVLVAVMSFKREDKSGIKWELNRFASNIHYVCQGIGGKLFKYFIRNYSPSEIKSFADRRWTVDEKNNMYIQLGFKFDRYTKPDYRYFNPKIDRVERIHKFNCRKQVLHKKYGLDLSLTETEMVKRLGYNRIWDCGLIKYVWKNDEHER